MRTEQRRKLCSSAGFFREYRKNLCAPQAAFEKPPVVHIEAMAQLHKSG
ncbi:hypothetical protein [uncultured Oscillibacter sp.]|nr:hypothetical protein [uncultured Oscillibacter sp.]